MAVSNKAFQIQANNAGLNICWKRLAEGLGLKQYWVWRGRKPHLVPESSHIRITHRILICLNYFINANNYVN